LFQPTPARREKPETILTETKQTRHTPKKRLKYRLVRSVTATRKDPQYRKAPVLAAPLPRRERIARRQKTPGWRIA
jgi:hypothetical protein